MAIDPITAGLQLGGDIVTGAVAAVGDYISTIQLRRLDEANQQATDDVAAFRDALLAGDLDAVNLRLAGLQSGVAVDLTDTQCDQLKGTTPGLDGFSLLGLYARARSADLAAQRNQILKDTASTVKPT